MLVIVYIASNDLFAVTINFLHGKNALTRENFKSCDLLGFYKFSRTEIVREKSKLLPMRHLMKEVFIIQLVQGI